MAGNPHVVGLLEEMLDSGKTPEEVCRNCPELLPEVRERWQAFCRIDAKSSRSKLNARRVALMRAGQGRRCDSLIG